MKIRKTFEFPLDLRYGVALEITGELRPATREECEAWLDKHTVDDMTLLGGNVEKVKTQILEGLEL